MRHQASDILIWCGTGVAVLCAVRLMLARDPFLRLHLVAPMTVLAAPLVVAGLVLRQWSSWHDVAKLGVIGVLLVVTGPATVVATARARRVPDE